MRRRAQRLQVRLVGRTACAGGHTLDVSEDAAFVACEPVFEVGEEVTVDVMVHDTVYTPIRLQCEVLRVVPARSEEEPARGVAVGWREGLSRKSRASLEAFLRHILDVARPRIEPTGQGGPFSYRHRFEEPAPGTARRRARVDTGSFRALQKVFGRHTRRAPPRRDASSDEGTGDAERETRLDRAVGLVRRLQDTEPDAPPAPEREPEERPSYDGRVAGPRAQAEPDVRGAGDAERGSAAPKRPRRGRRRTTGTLQFAHVPVPEAHVPVADAQVPPEPPGRQGPGPAVAPDPGDDPGSHDGARRGWKRVPIGAPVTYFLGAEAHVGEARNVSMGGLLVETEAVVPPEGARVNIRLPVMHGHRYHVVMLTAVIVWRRARPWPGEGGSFGARFLLVDDLGVPGVFRHFLEGHGDGEPATEGPAEPQDPDPRPDPG